jgi:hypothetical protein
MSDQARVAVDSPNGTFELTLPWSTTVGELFDQARARAGAGDFEFACRDGVTMMNKLQRTLQELRDSRICPKREFVLRPSPR